MTHVTQFRKPFKQQTCDLVVGLDFGTSCTKIVVRDPYRHRRGFAVPFGSVAHPSSHYLLPSVLWIDGDGEASLAKVGGGLYLRDIKHHLMRNEPVAVIGDGAGDQSFDPREVAVAFLALALQECRRWFIDTHKITYGNYTLDWQVNLGLPSADFADEKLCHDYLRIAAAAWRLSLCRGPISLRDAEKVYVEVAVEADEDEGSVGGYVDCGDDCSATIRLIPEVAAEVVGYARSHMREEGLHVLMDIGATTLDVCSFILHEKDDDDCYELLTADVRELGAMVLHRGRVAVVSEHLPEHGQAMWDNCDPVVPIPSSPDRYLPSGLPDPQRRELLQTLRDGDAQYRKEVKQALWQTLVDLKVRRDPNSRRWQDQLPVFIAGGASRMPFYRGVMDVVSEEVQGMYSSCGGIRQLSLARPEDLEADISDAAFHRLAVAWGLSYPETDIGAVTRPCEIDDIARPQERAAPVPEIGKEVT